MVTNKKNKKMKIVICGSMTASKEMLEIEKKLKVFGKV
jgi:hypothetical protein